MITGTTQLLGVIGSPIEHSLSPVMHNAAIDQLGINYVYLPFPVSPGQLAQAIAGFEAIGVAGFNVTIPHKQAVIPFLTEISPLAQAVGAVNTVYRTANGWGGTNTDVFGFVAPLQRCQRDWANTTVVVLGNGGAARAVVAGCHELGCARVQIVGRDADKLAAFAASWGQSPLADSLSTHLWDELPQLLPTAHLLVNTTPIGMHPHVEDNPVSADLLATLPAGAIAYDLIYTPNPTRFLQEAQDQGAIAIDGLEMLVQQGATALNLWTHQPIPIDVMRQSLIHHLGL